MATISNEDIEKQVITKTRTEVADWETGLAFITESIAFEMKNFIRQLRKNYWQVFNRPFDPITGKKKIFAPLTRTVVDGFYKNTPIDQKDVHVKAKKANRVKLAKVFRGFMYNKLKDMGFSNEMDLSRRQLAIDGTFVWKFIKNGKKVTTKFVDLLNFYIDPTAKSIKETEAVIERDPISISGFVQEAKDNNWINWEDVEGSNDVPEIDINTTSSQSNSIKRVELYRREGLAPKSWITGDDEDDEMIMIRTIISDSKGEQPKVHLIEEMKDKDPEGEIIKSYEETWADRIPGRWYGVGPAEKVMMLQLYLNFVYNTRINRNSVASLGMFKIKRNAGITPQAVSRMVSNGVIKVNQMDDISEMPVSEASGQSYTEENNIVDWGQRVTGLPDVTFGDESATQTATVGAINARSAAGTFVEIQKSLGDFVERGIIRHLMPNWQNTIKKGDIIRLTLDTDEVAEYDQEIADMAAEQLINDKKKEGIQFIPLGEVQEAQQKAINAVIAGRTERFAELLEDIDVTEYDIDVYVKSDKIDKNILVTDLINFSRIAPEFRVQVAEQLNDILGINLKTQQVQQQLEQQGQQRAAAGQIEEARTEEERVTGTNTLQGQGVAV